MVSKTSHGIVILKILQVKSKTYRKRELLIMHFYMYILLYFQISEKLRPQYIQSGNIQNRTLWSFVGQYLLGFLQYQ